MFASLNPGNDIPRRFAQMSLGDIDLNVPSGDADFKIQDLLEDAETYKEQMK